MKERYFKKSDGFVEKEIGEETILVPLVDSVAKMDEVITLNEIGSFIYKKLTNKKSFSALTREILETYEVSKEDAESDLTDFLNKAIMKKIIFETDQPNRS